jgi:hypothetical protein
VKPKLNASTSLSSPQLLRPLTAGPFKAWVRFWFSPVDPVGLHVLRLLSGLLFLGWLLPYAGHLDALFGLEGWFDRQAYAEAARLDGGPPAPLSWSILYACGSNSQLLAAMYWGSLAVLVLFTLGLWTRLTSVLSWVVVCSFTANPVLGFDGEVLLLILAFYLMLGYLMLGQQRQTTWRERLLGPKGTFLFGSLNSGAPVEGGESRAAHVVLRVVQVHLALLLVFTGLHKLQFGDWWAGVAFWYPLHPAFETTVSSARKNASWAETYLFFLSLAAYITLAWEIGFPLFAWRPRWRWVVLAGGFVGWLGSSFLYQIPVFGPALFIACLAFVSPAAWYRLRGFLGKRLVPARASARADAEAADEVVPEQTPSLVTVEQR